MKTYTRIVRGVSYIVNSTDAAHFLEMSAHSYKNGDRVKGREYLDRAVVCESMHRGYAVEVKIAA